MVVRETVRILRSDEPERNVELTAQISLSDIFCGTNVFNAQNRYHRRRKKAIAELGDISGRNAQLTC